MSDKEDGDSGLGDFAREAARSSDWNAAAPFGALPDAMGIPPVDSGQHDVLPRAGVQVPGEGLPEGKGPWSLRRNMSLAETETKLAQLSRYDWRPSFQIVLPTDTEISCGSPAWRTLESLCRQIYPEWTLQLVNCTGNEGPMQASQVPHSLLESFGDIAERVTLRRKGSRETVGFGLGNSQATASRGLVLVLRPGDELGCDALLEFALASAREPEADFLYSDDRRPTPLDERIDAFFKPGWSPELLLGWNYIGRSWCASQTLFRKAGLKPRRLIDYDDHDLVLRLTEVASLIVHVPRVLSQTGLDWSKGVASEIETLELAMQRRGLAGEVLLGHWPGQYRVKRQLQRPGLVSIIIPTTAAGGHIVSCIESLKRFTAYRNYEIICIENIPSERSECRGWLYKNANVVIHTTDAFHCPRFNNVAAMKARGEYLLFLHDVVKVIDPDWLEALLEHAQNPEVAVAGPQLLYPDCSVQHAGLVLDEQGRRRHAFQLLASEDAGYFGLARSERNVVGVAGACQLMRREVFDKLGGYEESDAVGHYDLDLCLRAGNAGLRNVYTPHASLIHFEVDSSVRPADRNVSPAFRERWGRLLSAGDPYFNPNLSREQDCFTAERDPVEIVYPARPLFARDAVRRILIVKLDDVGDAVAALPAVRKLRKHFPNARLSVLADCSTYPIWKMEPVVDEILEFNISQGAAALGLHTADEDDLQALTAQLAARRFDLAIDLHRRPDTREVLRYSRARWLAGYDEDGRFPWLDIAPDRLDDSAPRIEDAHISHDLVALVDRIAVAALGAFTPANLPEAPSLRLPSGLQKALFTRPLVCMHPALGSGTRSWTLDTYNRLIDRLLTEAGVNIAVIGDAKDRPASERLLNRDDGLNGIRGRLFDLIGKVERPELPALLSRAALFIGRDCGCQHRVGTQGMPGHVYVPELWTFRNRHPQQRVSVSSGQALPTLRERA